MTISIQEFYRDAQTFCLVIDQHQEYTFMEFVHQTVVHMASLYRSALDLPDVFVEDEPSLQGYEQNITLARTIGETFAEYNFYRVVIDAYSTDDTTNYSYGELGDDIADIYHELQLGLAYYDAGYPDYATEHWHFSFKTHWGRHIINALSALSRIAELQRFAS